MGQVWSPNNIRLGSSVCLGLCRVPRKARSKRREGDRQEKPLSQHSFLGAVSLLFKNKQRPETLLHPPTPPTMVPCLELMLNVSQREPAVVMRTPAWKGALDLTELQARVEKDKKTRLGAGSNLIVPSSHQACLPPSPPASTESADLLSLGSLRSRREFHLEGSLHYGWMPYFGFKSSCRVPAGPYGTPTPNLHSPLCSEASQDPPFQPLSLGPPAVPCPWPPSSLQGTASFSLAAFFSSFHVPGWLPGSAEVQT